MNNPLFYAKVLLFGEYGIIENSQGLTLPYSFYKGALKYSDKGVDFEKKSNESLKSFSNYIQKIQDQNEISDDFKIDIEKFNQDIQKGLFFDSNIPQGYGVGSSGALVAAVFEKYSIIKFSPETISKEKLKEIKVVFGKLESFFHGVSSGIDPLICYMNLPILIENKDNLDRVDIPKEDKGKGAIFLIDSGVQGETEPMVQIFFEKLKNEGFRKTLKEEFIAYNNACIQSFLKREKGVFFSNLKKLSMWVFENLKPMIPESTSKAWKNGLDSNDYYLKLCGSGGGGYILGFTRDYDKAAQKLKDFNKEIILRF